MVRLVPRHDCGRAQNAPARTVPRTAVREASGLGEGNGPSAGAPEASGYVDCTLSMVGSKLSPRFQSRRVMAANFRASVRRAISARMPRSSMPS